MRALVTGPTGCIGHALILELLSRGYEVIAVVRPASKNAASIPDDPRVMRIECELRDLLTLSGSLPPCSLFFHLGWEGTFGASRDTEEGQERNVETTLKAVRLAKALGCGAFLFAGSQSEFGHVDGVLSPDLPCSPVTFYGKAKLRAGILSRALCREFGIRHVECRLFSSFGPFDKPYNLIMDTVSKLLEKERLSFTAGDQVWDYLYSKDVAQALYLAAENGRDQAVYCVGSGRTRTLKEYLTAVRDIADPSQELHFGELPYYPSQVMHLEADIRTLCADTGFQPRYTFEEGVRETVEWAKRRRAGQTPADRC
ncbi:MAG: NAD(P)-dependent oxidoreductase [Lachnospiraceae bacterium]|nr:NAD(P)-dependent oxidoreductase [Lachnospiraceae bacterium]